MDIRLLLILLSLPTVMLFQNCSQVGISSNSAGLMKASDVPGYDDDLPVVEPPRRNDQIPGADTRRICTENGVQRLFAGQHFEVGRVEVSVSGNILRVRIVALPGVSISETHVNVASSAKAASGAPGSFPYKGSHSNVSEVVYNIDLRDHNLESGRIFVAVHAVVAPQGSTQVLASRETAWAEGERQGGGWQMVFEFAPQGCP